jgi:hypothetical protein
MILQKISGCETLEIEITGLKTQYFLPQNTTLRKQNILYILMQYCGGSVTQGYSPKNREIIDDQAYNDAYLVLVENNKEVINRIPLDMLWQNAAKFLPIINKEINIEKSYIEFSSTSNLSIGESIVFTFYYGNAVSFEFNKSYSIENVELVVNSTSQIKFDFSSLEHLKNKNIVLMQCITDVKSINGKDDAATINNRNRMYLTLVDKSKRQIINKLPLYHLIHTSEFLIPFNNLEIDWNNSFVEAANNSYLVANTAFSFLIYYINEETTGGSGSSNNNQKKMIVQKHQHTHVHHIKDN